MGDLESKDEYDRATVLDPRFKTRCFTEMTRGGRALTNLIDRIGVYANDATEPEVRAPKAVSSNMEDLQGLVCSGARSFDQPTRTQCVNEYMRLQIEDISICPI